MYRKGKKVKRLATRKCFNTTKNGNGEKGWLPKLILSPGDWSILFILFGQASADFSTKKNTHLVYMHSTQLKNLQCVTNGIKYSMANT